MDLHRKLYDYCRLKKLSNVQEVLQNNSQLNVMYENGDLFMFAGKHKNLEMFNTLVEYYKSSNPNSQSVVHYKLSQVCQNIQDTYVLSEEMEQALDQYTSEFRHQDWLNEKFALVKEAVEYGQYNLIDTIASLMETNAKKAVIYRKAANNMGATVCHDTSQEYIDQIIDYYTKAIELNPKYSCAHKSLGYFYQRINHDLKAFESFIQAYIYKGQSFYEDVYDEIRALVKCHKHEPTFSTVANKYSNQTRSLPDLFKLLDSLDVDDNLSSDQCNGPSSENASEDSNDTVVTKIPLTLERLEMHNTIRDIPLSSDQKIDNWDFSTSSSKNVNEDEYGMLGAIDVVDTDYN